MTGATLVEAFLIGLTETADTAHSRPGDLADLGRSLVDREKVRIGG